MPVSFPAFTGKYDILLNRQLVTGTPVHGQSSAIQLPALTGVATSDQYYMPKLPAGLTFSPGTRTITGTPTVVRKALYPYIGTRGDDAALKYLQIFVYQSESQRDDRHDCILFKYPINYGQDGRNVANPAVTDEPDGGNNIGDNDYQTSSTASRYVIDTTVYGPAGAPDGETNSGTDITHLFIKCKGVTSFTPKLKVYVETDDEFNAVQHAKDKIIVVTADIDSGITKLDSSGTAIMNADENNIFIGLEDTDRWGTGDSVSNSDITIENSVSNWEGKPTRINTDGFQNFLYTLPTPQTDIEELTISFTPQNNIQIYEIMVLNEAMRLDANGRFTEIIYKISDTSSILKKDLAERVTKISGPRQERWKWEINYTSLFRGSEINTKESADDVYNNLLNFIKDRDNNNFAIASEYTRYPERVYPCTIPSPDMQLGYLSSTFKGSGESIGITILEL